MHGTLNLFIVAFLDCDHGRLCWERCSLWNIIENDFSELFFKVCRRLNKEQLSLFSMVLWSFWNSRNSKLWDAAIETTAQVVTRAVEVLNSLRFARRDNTQVNTSVPPLIIEWSPPPEGFLKCNVDAALFKDLNRVGTGMCIRNNVATFCLSRTDWIEASMTAAESEA